MLADRQGRRETQRCQIGWHSSRATRNERHRLSVPAADKPAGALRASRGPAPEGERLLSVRLGDLRRDGPQ